MEKTILVTGGAGFIGSNFILQWIAAGRNSGGQPRQADVRGQSAQPAPGRLPIRDIPLSREMCATANCCVDCSSSISPAPSSILRPRVMWTVRSTGRMILSAPTFLEHSVCWKKRGPIATACRRRIAKRSALLHVSTDEVYGSLGPDDPPFCETTAYAPNSPYSASKAAADHLVRAYHHTYGLPTLTTNCSNNYGPYQFPEKLIPLVILNARAGKPLPVYGDGQNVRDWVFVEDHCDAMRRVLAKGRVGETYNIGGARARNETWKSWRPSATILDQSCPNDPVRAPSKVDCVREGPARSRSPLCH